MSKSSVFEFLFFLVFFSTTMRALLIVGRKPWAGAVPTLWTRDNWSEKLVLVSMLMAGSLAVANMVTRLILAPRVVESITYFN